MYKKDKLYQNERFLHLGVKCSLSEIGDDMLFLIDLFAA